jgi:hypothetical protein
MTATTVGYCLWGMTFLVFLLLKLTGAIAWSWWWVTSPLWILAVLELVMWAIIGVILYRTYVRVRRPKTTPSIGGSYEAH